MTLCFISIYFQLPFCWWSETVQAGCRSFPFRGICSLLWAGSFSLALRGLLAAHAARSFALVRETLPALFEPMALPSDHLGSCYKVSPAAFFLCQNISTDSWFKAVPLHYKENWWLQLVLRALHASPDRSLCRDQESKDHSQTPDDLMCKCDPNRKVKVLIL